MEVGKNIYEVTMSISEDEYPHLMKHLEKLENQPSISTCQILSIRYRGEVLRTKENNVKAEGINGRMPTYF